MQRTTTPTRYPACRCSAPEDARWLLENEGKIVVTLPDGSRLETAELGSVLAAAQGRAVSVSRPRANVGSDVITSRGK